LGGGHSSWLGTLSSFRTRKIAFKSRHEAVEAYLCKQAGVSQAAVDRFDQAYERRRKPGDDSEPGDDPKAPYHFAHVFATKVEHMIADQLRVNWGAYDREVSSEVSSK
jgi:hypothetical protein